MEDSEEGEEDHLGEDHSGEVCCSANFAENDSATWTLYQVEEEGEEDFNNAIWVRQTKC